MENLDVRIIHLEPLHVAAALGFGPGPEMLAWETLLAWMRANDLADVRGARFFGFNNPDPSPGSPNYGYEQWVTVDAAARPEGGVTIKDIPGGTYAVTRCRLENITETWKALVIWLEDSPMRFGPGQCLEECLTPQIIAQPGDQDLMQAVFDLYLPVAV